MKLAYEKGLDVMFECDHAGPRRDGPYPCQSCARVGLKAGVEAARAEALEEAAKVVEALAPKTTTGRPYIAEENYIAAIRALGEK